MEKKAEELMGEPVQAGSVIATRGHVSRAALGGGGLIGGLIAGAVAAAQKPPSTPGNHRGLVYMAAGPTKVAFFEVNQGWFSQSLGTLLAEHRREDVAAMDVQGGMVPKIEFALADGTNYALECGMVFLGKVKKIKAALER
jgi:hypothetical protein